MAIMKTLFPNLARDHFDLRVDEAVKDELVSAGVPVIELYNIQGGEVKTYYIGYLNGFLFERAWKYWVVKGKMPLDIAKQMYVQHKDFSIRAGGDAADAPPEEWAKDGFVDMYHIDTIEGLKAFAEIIKTHNLVSTSS